MVLVDYERILTLGLCSFYFLCNAVNVKCYDADKKKDLLYVSDERVFQKNYRFEDFFWTGSEDDVEGENSNLNKTELGISLEEASPLETWKTTTVFHTTTILFATVYPDSESCLDTKQGCTPKISPVQTRSIEFSLPTPIPEFSEISPCPTQKVSVTDTLQIPNIFLNHHGVGGGVAENEKASTTPKFTGTEVDDNKAVFQGTESNKVNETGTTVFPSFPLDQQYWIMTILRNDNSSQNIELSVIENKLSTLYKKALQRRQEKYFRGNDFHDRKDRKMSQQVKVNILNVTRNGQNLELLYHVTMADQLVPAMTVVNDMRLMTASEVIAELGYPILSKAEPYLKSVVPLGARVKGRTRDTWLFIGSVTAAVLLLIILAALFTVELSKKHSKQTMRKELEKKKHFQKEKGTSNLAFEEENMDVNCQESSHGSQAKAGSQSPGVAIRFSPEKKREQTSSSSCSGSSEASLVRLRHQQKKREMQMKEVEGKPKPKPKPRTRAIKVENSKYSENYERTVFDRAGSAISQNTFNEIVTDGYDDSRFSPYMTKSPTSYLSMPSVKAFPKGTQIPEPLNKILEPISIRHFDVDSDSPNEHTNCSHTRHEVDIKHICELPSKYSKRKAVTRHASLEGNDPGYIGPIVWNRHCQKVGETVVIEGINVEETEENASVGRMRRRFNELLDDALSMFGSRNSSPDGTEGRSLKQADSRVYSAVVRPAGTTSEGAAVGRPKTTGSKRPQSAVISGPRGAWETPNCSTLGGTWNADTTTVFQKFLPSPTVDKNLIYVNSDLAPSDPAIPLIAAIKSELKKFEEFPKQKS